MTSRKLSVWHAYNTYYVHPSDCPNSTKIISWHLISYMPSMGVSVCPHECCGPLEYIEALEMIYNKAFNREIKEKQ